jgi:hypothetical protein
MAGLKRVFQQKPATILQKPHLEWMPGSSPGMTNPDVGVKTLAGRE